MPIGSLSGKYRTAFAGRRRTAGAGTLADPDGPRDAARSDDACPSTGPSHDEVTVVEDGVEQHHALDHPALRGRLSEAAVGLADRRPERLVVDVKHAPAMQLPRRDRRREPPLDEVRDEVGALLAMDDAREGAVLALDEDARVQQHVQQEPRLAFGEAERRDRLQALSVGQLDRPAVGGGGSVIGSAPRRVADGPCAGRRHRVRRPSRRSRNST